MFFLMYLAEEGDHVFIGPNRSDVFVSLVDVRFEGLISHMLLSRHDLFNKSVSHCTLSHFVFSGI